MLTNLNVPAATTECGGATLCVMAGDKLMTAKKPQASLLQSIQELTDAQGVDWRTKGDVPAVLNTGSCGYDDLYPAVNLVEAAHAVATGKLERLSIQQILDCSGQKNNCMGPWVDALTYI